MNELIPFKFENRKVRITDRDGNPWFVATDVCRILELNNITEALRPLDDDEKFALSNSEGEFTDNRAHRVNIINESGLYSLIFRSRKPEAKRFKKWVTSVVLPQIRKTGGYGATEQRLAKIEEQLAKLSKEKELWEENGRLRRSRTRATPKDKQEILELYRNGYTKAQIQREIFRGIGCIKAVLKAAELMANQPGLFDDEAAARGKGGAV